MHLRRVLSAAVLSAALMGGGGAAATAAPVEPPAAAPVLTEVGPAPVPEEAACVTVYNVRNVGAWYQTTRSHSAWPYRVQGTGPGNLSLNHSIGVGSSVSGTGGATIGAINAAVGFEVNRSWSAQTQFSRDVPAGQTWVVYADTLHDNWKFDVFRTNVCGPGAEKVGTYTATRFNTFDYGSYRV